MIRIKNRKIKIISSALSLILLVGLVSGFVWMRGSEGSKAIAENGQTSISACTNTSLSGYAWTENVGWISMSKGTDYSVKIDPSTGIFSGYAWSENIGWVNFAPASGFPFFPQSAPEMDLATGNIAGWASILVNQNDTTTKGWISMSNPIRGYGVKVDLVTGKLSGFAWSEDYGWIDFSRVTWSCIAGVVEPTTLIYNDGILVYTSAQRKGTTDGDASVTGTGTNVTVPDIIIYTLELTNQGNAAKAGVNLKFDMPKGYTYSNISYCSANFLPCPTMTSAASNLLTWNNVTVPVGESSISFELKAP